MRGGRARRRDGSKAWVAYESKFGYASDVNDDKYEMCWLIEEALRVRSWRE